MTKRMAQSGLAAVLMVVLSGCEMPSMRWPGRAKPILTEEGEDAFTVLLGRVSGLEHARRAKLLQASIAQETTWDDVFVVGQAGHSQMCRGKFRSIDKAQKTLLDSQKYIRRLPDGEQFKPFPRAMVIKLPGKNIGPSKWDLTRQKGDYTVEVATFYDVPEAHYVGRKEFAVDYCTQLREEGFPAYYYHGPARSSVTIGVWPASCVRVAKDNRGRPRLDGNGQPLKEIIEPEIKKIRNSEKFRYYAVNGRQEKVRAMNPDTREVIWVPRRTELMRIQSGNEPSKAVASPVRPTEAFP